MYKFQKDMQLFCFLCCFTAVKMKIITLWHRYFLWVLISKRAWLLIVQQTMLITFFCGCIINKEMCLLVNKETVSCTRSKTMQVTNIDNMLMDKNKHLTVKQKIKLLLLLVCYTLWKVVFFIYKQNYAGKGNRCVLGACGLCQCVQYLSVK